MSGFRNYGEAVDSAVEEGRHHFCSFRKVPAQAIVTGRTWQDLSMAAGNPPPQYYAASPLAAAVLDGARGIFHGYDKAPATMWLYELGITTSSGNAAGPYHLLDYLLYYPFVDLDDTDPQTMDNTVTLPRYTDGAGVRAIGVLVAPTTGGGSFTYTYINQDGVERTSIAIPLSTAAESIASLVSTQPGQASAPSYGPYLPLVGDDTGIRSIVSVQVSAPGGGLMTIALVKPLYSFVVDEGTLVTHEFVLLGPSLRPSEIKDGAYLGLICSPVSSIAGASFSGHMKFIWK